MTIRKNLVLLNVWVVLLCETNFLTGIIGIPEEIVRYISFFCVVVGFILAWSRLKSMGSLHTYKYLNIYVIIYLICVGLSAIYTITNRISSVNQTIFYSRYYLSILMVYPLIYLKEQYFTNCFSLDGIMKFVVIMSVVRAANAFVYDMYGIAFFPDFISFQIRGGHSTAPSNALDILAALYFMIEFLNSQTRKRRFRAFLWFIVEFIYLARFVSSRMMILAVLGAAGGSWLINKKVKKEWITIFLVAVIGIAIFLNTPYYNDLMSTITTASATQGDDNTASARLVIIENMNKYMQGKILGTGMLTFGTSNYTKFYLFGASDDLGYLGNFYTFGVLCVPMIVMLLGRVIYLYVKGKNRLYADMYFGLIAYLIITGITVSIFNTPKVFALPFVLMLIETSNKDMKQIN